MIMPTLFGGTTAPIYDHSHSTPRIPYGMRLLHSAQYRTLRLSGASFYGSTIYLGTLNAPSPVSVVSLCRVREASHSHTRTGPTSIAPSLRTGVRMYMCMLHLVCEST